MRIRCVLSTIAVFCALAAARNADAAQTRIEPFIGKSVEDFEAFANFNATIDTLGHRSFLTGITQIFSGQARISHPQIGIYEPAVANYNLGTSGDAQVANGQKGFGLGTVGPQILPEYVEFATIDFSEPAHQFGGYWGAATDYLFFDPEVIEFEFYDVAGNLVGTDERPYTRSFLIDEGQMIYFGDGEMLWTGWQFDVPVQRIVFGGGFIVADYLQANFVPEPSACALLSSWFGFVALTYRRRIRSNSDSQ